MKDLTVNKYALKFSYIAIIVIVSHSILFKDFWKSWKSNETQFVWDVDNYYSYLPATVIHHDLTFQYTTKYWYTMAPNGARVAKGTCGMAIMYAPWFFLGHKIAINTHVPQDGYSGPYNEMIHYGTIFYSLIGFIFMRRILSRYFKDIVVAATLICLYFGTNLFYYTVAEGAMTHSYLFCLFSLYIWLVIKWHEKPKIHSTIFLGLLLGLITLIRPTEIIIGLIFLLYDVHSWKEFKTKMAFLWSKWALLLLMAVCAFLVVLPQLIYWKWITGHYFFFSYGSTEHFFFGDPKIINVLFSYRKGWLVYTPLMVFSVIGMLFGKRYFPKINLSLLIYFVVNLYLIASWWCWWYGGGFGMRALVQSYCMLGLFLAAFINFIVHLNIKWSRIEVSIKYLTITIAFAFISLNLIQTYQYNKRMLHFDSMTKKAYWILFGKFEFEGKDEGEYWNSLKAIDYAKANNGERDQ